MAKIVAIIQARMGSRRLPGKVLMDIAGRPMLWHVVRRALGSGVIDTAIVASTTRREDDPIIELCSEWGVPRFRGHPTDVLDRYYQAAVDVRAEHIVRITADCPLLDSDVLAMVANRYIKSRETVTSQHYDYVSNVQPRTFPDGLDVECFPFTTLQRCWEEATSPEEREHMTQYIRDSGTFKRANIVNPIDLSHLRWTVDTAEDLAFVRSVYAGIGRHNFGMLDVLQWQERKEQ